jgi:AGCS family alanine or glycine:cation symporter
MWMVAFLGASSAFVESTLGQVYKEEVRGQHRGGPAFYIEKGMGMKWYAVTFAIVTIFACGLLLPGVQANSIGSGLQNAMDIHPNTTAALLAIMLGMIIFGGVKRIASFTEVVVPFMALGYIIVACVIVMLHIEQLPDVIALIFKSAFGLEAGFGAILGQAIMWGVKRGVYSNEAGQGTGPHASSAAAVSHPAKQGLVQGFSVYIDTLFVCSATAFMLLVTGQYNVQGADGEALFTGIAGVAAGPGYVQNAMENIMPGFGSYFVAIALFFFAFTTILGNYTYAENNLIYLGGGRGGLLALRLAALGTITWGVYSKVQLVWDAADASMAVMASINLVALVMLSGVVIRLARDYDAQLRSGRDPEFRIAEHPELGEGVDKEIWR